MQQIFLFSFSFHNCILDTSIKGNNKCDNLSSAKSLMPKQVNKNVSNLNKYNHR